MERVQNTLRQEKKIQVKTNKNAIVLELLKKFNKGTNGKKRTNLASV